MSAGIGVSLLLRTPQVTFSASSSTLALGMRRAGVRHSVLCCIAGRMSRRMNAALELLAHALKELLLMQFLGPITHQRLAVEDCVLRELLQSFLSTSQACFSRHCIGFWISSCTRQRGPGGTKESDVLLQ